MKKAKTCVLRNSLRGVGRGRKKKRLKCDVTYQIVQTTIGFVYFYVNHSFLNWRDSLQIVKLHVLYYTAIVSIPLNGILSIPLHEFKYILHYQVILLPTENYLYMCF
jgi:hypothetical protein